MIKLYQFQISPFCDKIRRILHVKKVPYQTEEVSLLAVTTGYKKVNPIGKVPCIEDGGQYIADSTDIAYYLEDKYPEPKLVPTAPADRALCHILEDWADESLYFYEMRLRFTFPNNAKRWTPELLHADPAMLRPIMPPIVERSIRGTAKAQGVGKKPDAMILRDVERHVQALAGWLGDRDYLVQNTLSLADISVFAQMFCIRGAEEGERIISATPKVAAWMSRVDSATAPRA